MDQLRRQYVPLTWHAIALTMRSHIRWHTYVLASGSSLSVLPFPNILHSLSGWASEHVIPIKKNMHTSTIKHSLHINCNNGYYFKEKLVFCISTWVFYFRINQILIKRFCIKILYFNIDETIFFFSTVLSLQLIYTAGLILITNFFLLTDFFTYRFFDRNVIKKKKTIV